MVAKIQNEITFFANDVEKYVAMTNAVISNIRVFTKHFPNKQNLQWILEMRANDYRFRLADTPSK